MEHKSRIELIDDYFDSISVKEFEKIAIAAGAKDMAKSNVSKNIVLHQGIRTDNGKEITGFLSLTEKPWNRWYVNEKMLPRLQDTVLICKGWYNKEKYPNVYEALRAYWAAIAEVSVEDIGYDAVLQCLLLPACEAFLCNRKFCELFYERIYKLDIVMREFEKIKKHKNKAEYREMNAEYLIEILTDALFALRNDEYSSKKRPEDGYCVV